MDKLLKMIVAMQIRLTQASDKERGATATEYALLVAMIATVIIVGVAIFGSAVSDFFSTLGTTVGNWTSGI
jgi:pilus assembly protein Flp/PilA